MFKGFQSLEGSGSGSERGIENVKTVNKYSKTVNKYSKTVNKYSKTVNKYQCYAVL